MSFLVYADVTKDGTPLKRRKYFTGMVERWPELLADRARAIRFQVRADARAAADRMRGYIFKIEPE